jgi:hypothetical protein
MAENPYDSPQTPDENIVVASGVYKDRSTGLILFGCFQILLGSLCGLMVPLMLFSISITQQTGQPVANIVPAVAMYVVLAISGITLGIGSIRCRRWARAITLVCSWMWLLTGLVSMVFLLVFMPRMLGQISGQQSMPGEAKLFLIVFTGGFAGCFYVILPAVFVAFYQNSHVKATCEIKNPNECWTDRCPLPVLAMSIALGFGAFSVMMMLPTAVFPLFGSFVSGLPATLIFVVIGVVLAALAYGTYKLQMTAWWVTLILVMFWATSTLVTFARSGLMGMYEQMNMPEEQLELIRQMGIAGGMASTLTTAVATAIILGYILFVRKYFVAAGHRELGES